MVKPTFEPAQFSRTQTILRSVVAVALFFVLLLCISRAGWARPDYMKDLPGPLKGDCTVCHLSKAGGGPFNAFGTAYGMSGHNLNAIADQDSDGDGFTNGEELGKGTNPGNPASYPGKKKSAGFSINGVLGNNLLLATLLLVLFTFVIGAFGSGLKDARLLEASRRGLVVSFGVSALAMILLLRAFFTNDFQIEYVQHHSNLTMPWYYKFTGLWGGQEGSLLLWLFVLGAYSAILALTTGRYIRAFGVAGAPAKDGADPYQALFYGYTYTILAAIQLFFAVVLVFLTPPFRMFLAAPKDGAGLNALLQNPYMIIHPPMLYLGYVGMTVPFAFALAALMGGKLDAWWLRRMRIWAMTAWMFLTCGVILGAAWAYVALSFGGYWAWDPVENASFLPWLACTAYLHSQMITERRDMMKIWNLALIALAFWLSILGTFITRSGVISSVHAFAEGGALSPALMGLLIAIIVVTVLMLYYRWNDLQSTEKIESPVSREGAFLVNNWVFLGLIFTILWGTMYPILSGWASLLRTGKETKGDVGAAFFNQITIPLFLILLFITGVGPHIAWRRATPENLRRGFYWPGWIGFAVFMLTTAAGLNAWKDPLGAAFAAFQTNGFLAGVSAIGAFGIGYWLPYFGFGISAFMVATMGVEFWRGVKARKKMKGDPPLVALKNLILKNRRRYGGFIVHIGIAMMAIGITASSAFKTTKDVNVAPGESFDFYKFHVTFDKLSQEREPGKGYEEVRAYFVIKEGNHEFAIHPSKRFFDGGGTQPAAQASITSTFLGDLYVTLSEWTEDNDPNASPPYTASVRFTYQPLVPWIWIGGLVVLLGGLISLTFRFLKDEEK